MTNTKIAAAARRAGLAGLLGAAAAATVVGFAGAAHAGSDTPTQNTKPAKTQNTKPADGMYGNPAAAARYWQKQHTGDCAEMAVADVVGEITGHEPTEQQILDVAKNSPSKVHPGPIWEPGTAMGDIPTLLDHYGIQYETGFTNPPAMERMEQVLAQGRKVIVAVNAQTIWSAIKVPNVDNDHTTLDHAVVVTAVDTKAGVVHLNDSGQNIGRDERVPIAAFEQAWAKSAHWIVATK
jgi:uncharacterized protein YvpB